MGHEHTRLTLKLGIVGDCSSDPRFDVRNHRVTLLGQAEA